MGKHEVCTPKFIANKIKAKGLQKLRWFCQMCEKQCRDENGFKCHTMSESHQRQLLLFADSPGRFMSEFSRQFERDFLELLRHRFGTKRVLANKVYQEYITDRKHLHMNATHWETLTDFVKYLGREGKAIADETEKGWFITYVDRSPENILAQEAKSKQEKLKKDDEDRMQKFIEKQIEIGKQSASTSTSESAPTELIKAEDEKISLKLNFKPFKKPELKSVPKAFLGEPKRKKLKTDIKPMKKPEQRYIPEPIFDESKHKKMRLNK
ncbi:DNA/RNA-binding protein KIN17 [Planococcus citri]|uniref:DNA/RNA-binding protein KIN17 n=1 Tax=Planococcus citri TaxID=170843 RepID=UPI0031F94E4D